MFFFVCTGKQNFLSKTSEAELHFLTFSLHSRLHLYRSFVAFVFGSRLDWIAIGCMSLWSSRLCVLFSREGHGKILVILTASIHKVVERIRWKSWIVRSRFFFKDSFLIFSTISAGLIDDSIWGLLFCALNNKKKEINVILKDKNKNKGRRKKNCVKKGQSDKIKKKLNILEIEKS